MANLRLGQLLVDARMLSQQALDEVLQQQSSDGRRLGTLLVERGLINETQLTQILSHQLSVPWVALLHIEFSRQLLNLVPLEIAEKYCLVPIYVRHVRGQGDTLYVAMDDPTNEEPLRECMKYSGLPVRPMIAPPSDIREAIRVCYGVDIESPHSKASRSAALRPKAAESSPATMPPSGDENEKPIPKAAPAPSPSAPKAAQRTPGKTPPAPPPSSETAAEATLGMPSVPEAPITPRVVTEQAAAHSARENGPGVSVVSAPALSAAAPAVQAPAPSPVPPRPYDDTPVVEAIEIEIPRSRRARAMDQAAASESGPSSRRGPRSQRMISVTLLDGTTLALPAQHGLSAAAPVEEAPAEAKVETAIPEGDAAVNAVREMVTLLQAAARRSNASASSGENARVEAVLAAIVSVLLKKQLITEREILEELSKM